MKTKQCYENHAQCNGTVCENEKIHGYNTPKAFDEIAERLIGKGTMKTKNGRMFLDVNIDTKQDNALGVALDQLERNSIDAEGVKALRLLNAAPEMLECLKFCEKWFERFAPVADLANGKKAMLPMLDSVKQVISKAEGQGTRLPKGCKLTYWAENLKQQQGIKPKVFKKEQPITTTVSPEVAAWMDPDRSLQKAGLMVVNQEATGLTLHGV